MAHGTGYYIEPLYKVNGKDMIIRTKEWCATVRIERHYWYPLMSDSYEPDHENTGKYEICVAKWRTDRWGNRVADHISDNVRSGLVSKEIANKIWWNLEHRNISFEDCERYFTELAGQKLTA